MSAEPKVDVYLIDFDSIELIEEKGEPEIANIKEEDGFFRNTDVADDFRIRSSIYEQMKRAQKHLPEGYYFMIFEAYRPLARQLALWDKMVTMMTEKYPDAAPQEIHDMSETFTADPHNGIGSGHQACCAIDISLCDRHGNEYDMGTKMHEFNEFTPTFAKEVSEPAQKNRKILFDALEAENLINYPAEWWHFSYGDHQWAYIVGETKAVFGPINI